MKYRIYIQNVAAMLLLASAPLLFFGSCTENDLVVSAEGGEEKQVAIVPNAVASANDAGDETVTTPLGPINGLQEGMVFGFERGDYNAEDDVFIYDEDLNASLTGTCFKTETNDGYNINLSPRQFYAADGTNTRMRGWYPATGSWDGGSNRDDYTRTILWENVDGTQDIMVSNELEGNKTNVGINGHAKLFTFKHKLTQLQLYVCAENENVKERLGEVTDIKVLKQPTELQYTSGKDGDELDSANEGLLENTGSSSDNADYTVLLSGGATSITPGIYEDNADSNYGAVYAGSIMLLPGEDDGQDAVLFSVTTEKRTGEDALTNENTQALDITGFEAGNAYKVILLLQTNDIYLVPQPEPTEWRTIADETADDVDLGESDKGYPYVESERYIVSRDYFGSADFSDVSGIKTIRINEKWTSNDDCRNDEASVPAILEVGPLLGEGGEATAANLEAAKGQCPAGWRLPTKAELLLIREVQAKDADALGDRALVGSYWTVDGSTVDVGTGTVTENASTGNVRCVRDI